MSVGKADEALSYTRERSTPAFRGAWQSHPLCGQGSRGAVPQEHGHLDSHSGLLGVSGWMQWHFLSSSARYPPVRLDSVPCCK